jgi:ectoine hydroxylase-related dioxygenase (phytanoyl-CoA dioxygenase family)
VSTPRSFAKFDLDHLDDACAFFSEHGFVVLRGVLSDVELDTITGGWDSLIAEACREVNLSVDEFVARFPQNRDLWMKSGAFRDLLFETKQADVAKSLLGVTGVRLFHDHAIAKPSQRSSTIPWHQDNAYWPVDRAGLSLWTSVNDVDENGGCLTVLDGSHLDGPAVPQDFLAAREHWQDQDPRLLDIPVQRGDTVVLHGLTWHCSRPNQSDVDRLAYLSLWIPLVFV